MKTKFYFTGIVIVLFQISILGQTTKRPYDLLAKIKIETPYAEAPASVKSNYDSLFYETARLTKNYECLVMNYKSDTATVEAWVYKPKKLVKRLPLIIYNHGGTGNSGNLDETNLVDFYKMAENGYVVIATKTRFSGENGKYDQIGGADINDIVNLKKVYASLSYVDTFNVFMYGFSRGGQTTYQASLKLKLNAMAVTAATTDWVSKIKEKREFVRGWTDTDPNMSYKGFAAIFPNWKKDSIQILKDRSPLMWAQKIKTPVLMMHSKEDTKVPVDDSRLMAEKLKETGTVHQLIIYDIPGHSLPFSQFDSFDQMFKWFEKYKTMPKQKSESGKS